MISIVIPLYNKEKSIAKTLDSVLAQSYTQYECLIVNDGSTDKSADVVRDVICKMGDGIREKFYLIEKENGGVCSARNRGIEEAKGEYIALLDGDDLWDKDFLNEAVKMLEDFPEAAMWGINFAEMANGKLVRYLPTGLPTDYRGYVDDYFELAYKGRRSDLFCSSSVVIRKSVFSKVGMFDERIRYGEDNDMWWRIIACNRVAFYDRYMCFYLVDAENRALKRKRYLTQDWVFYVDKYQNTMFKQNLSFYSYINRLCSQDLVQYRLFTDERRDTIREAIKKLDLSVLPLKYMVYFYTPRWLAKKLFFFIEGRKIKNKD